MPRRSRFTPANELQKREREGEKERKSSFQLAGIVNCCPIQKRKREGERKYFLVL